MHTSLGDLKLTLVNHLDSLEKEASDLQLNLDSLHETLPDLIDQANAESQRKMLFARHQQLQKNIGEVHQALKMIERGDFGICEICGEDIPVRRLFARPGTTLCVRCQELVESGTMYSQAV